MKPSFTLYRRLPAAAIWVAVTTAHAAGATQIYHDGSALNTWNTTDSNWDGSTTTWESGNDAIFAGTGEAVTVTEVSAHLIAINSGGYSFTGGTITLTGATPTITTSADTWVASVISGTGLRKAGTAILTLSGSNTYSGITSVNAGTLELGQDGSLRFSPGANGTVNGITGTGTVKLNGTFNFNLASANLTDGNSWLIVDVNNLAESYGDDFGVSGFIEVAPGVWKLESDENTWIFTQSTGELELAVADPYLSWTGVHFPGETNPAVTGPDEDPDGDGIPNGIEFVIGSDPSDSPSTALLPTASVNAGHLNFTFLRTDAATGYNPYVEYSTSLAEGSWIEAEPGVDGVVIVEEDDIDGHNTARVTVEFPKTLAAPGTVLFARLRIDIAPPDQP